MKGLFGSDQMKKILHGFIKMKVGEYTLMISAQGMLRANPDEIKNLKIPHLLCILARGFFGGFVAGF
jgi:hypothetical protein